MLMYSTRNLTYNPCSIGKKYIFYIYKIKNADIHMKKKGNVSRKCGNVNHISGIQAQNYIHAKKVPRSMDAMGKNE